MLRRIPIPANVPGSRRTARWLALRGVLEPVVVYQMAKVGSSAVVDALARSRLPVFHVHRIHPQNIERLRGWRRELGWRPYAPAYHELMAAEIRERVIVPHRPARFVTIVRDPIARNLSSYFEHLDAIWNVDRAYDVVPIEQICERFATAIPHDEALVWFDNEMLPVLGIDVYRTPFPAEGHAVVRSDRYEALILKSEASDDVKRAALERFLEVPVAPLERVYRTAATPKGTAYSEFLQRVRLTPQYVDRMLASRYARHFYTDAEREAMRRRHLPAGECYSDGGSIC